MYLPSAPKLFYDNIGAIYLSANLIFHSRMKHVEIDFHFVWEKVLKKDLQVLFLSTKEQVVDGFTKALSKLPFHKFRDKLHVSRSS